MTRGAVEFQRQGIWCDGCGRVVPKVRAVRREDGWHSDWECVHVVTGHGHQAATADPDSGALRSPPTIEWEELVAECHGRRRTGGLDS